MFKNYIKIALRVFSKNAANTLINIAGLSVALSCFILLLLYVHHEYSYDKFHKKADRIFRVNITDRSDKTEDKHAIITAAVSPDMMQEYAEIENQTRVSIPFTGFLGNAEKIIEEDNLSFVDSSFFDIFSFELLSGNPTRVLTEPNTIVLSASLASKLFGDENPLGKVVQLDSEDDLTVTGVMRDFPSNSQLQLSALISFTTLLNKPVFLDWNGGWGFLSYVLLNEKYNIGALEQKFPSLLDRKINHLLPEGTTYVASLERLTDIHLFTEVLYALPTKGSHTTVIIFLSIAIIILFLACINFVNLTTAQVSKRIKEIGVRKVVGASKIRLVHQFLLESLFISTISFLVALELTNTFQDTFSQMVGVPIDIWNLKGIEVMLLGIVIILLVGFVSGSYPALYMSSFRPAAILKGHMKKGHVSVLTRILLTFQFVVSISLVCATLVIYDQLSYLQNKELGYASENVLTIKLSSQNAKDSFHALKQSFSQLSEVVMVGASSELPGQGYTSNGYTTEDIETPIMFNALDIDPDYLPTMDLSVLEGRNFIPGQKSDSNAYLINQALATKMGWEEPIGKVIRRNGDHPIIGVVEDFHFATLHQKINPLIINMKPYLGYNHLSIRVNSKDLQSTIEKLKASWNQVLPNEPFNIDFLDKGVESLYQKEAAFNDLFISFSLMAIVIASLGLYGLVSHSTQQRHKEVGVRKVLGASIGSLWFLLSKGIIRLFIMAIIIGWPIAYFALVNWLENFAYRIDITVQKFIVGSILFILIAGLTVFMKFLKSINANPVHYLRDE